MTPRRAAATCPRPQEAPHANDRRASYEKEFDQVHDVFELQVGAVFL